MARGKNVYPVPKYLQDIGISQDDYGTWLDRITNAHVKRDRQRSTAPINRATYRCAIHKAVCDSNGYDFYTGEELDWKSLQHFNCDFSLNRKDHLIPSLDHIGLDPSTPVFNICSLRTNKCKSNYTIEQLIDFCCKLLIYQKISGSSRNSVR
jgi:hypothetical protein